VSVLLQIGAALGGLSFVAGIITALAMWRKNGADAASVLTDRALRAATSSIENLEKQLERTTEELRALRRHMSVLEGLLRQGGVTIPDFDWPPTRSNGAA
jgi:hypothetical protein